jgi:hypothetical protein
VRRRDPGPPLWTDTPPTANHHPLLKEQLVNPRIRWSQAPASWEAPGWAPLVDHGPLPLQTARSFGRWLWPTLSIGGFLVVVGFVFGNDDPAPGLSLRGLCTIALAAAVVALLTVRRTAGLGPLTRALFEYAVVFVLAVLVATTGVNLDQPPAAGKPTAGKQASSLRDQRPALVTTIDSFRDWLGEWRTWAHTETDRRAQSSLTTPALSPTTRSPL